MASEPKKIGQFQSSFGLADVYLTHYVADNSIAILLMGANDGEEIGTLSTCVEGAELNPDEVLIKTWSENEPIAKEALASGLFKDTGRRVATGFVEAQVWRLEESEAIELDECGCCSCYHRREFHGDCRNDAERFAMPYIVNGINTDYFPLAKAK